jgi:hypothetical protein
MKTMEIFVNISSEMHICKNRPLFQYIIAHCFILHPLHLLGTDFFGQILLLWI